MKLSSLSGSSVNFLSSDIYLLQLQRVDGSAYPDFYRFGSIIDYFVKIEIHSAGYRQANEHTYIRDAACIFPARTCKVSSRGPSVPPETALTLSTRPIDRLLDRNF